MPLPPLPGQSLAYPLPITADSGVTADSPNVTADGWLSGPFARVSAVRGGFYGGQWRDIGDVFDIYFAEEFSNYQINYGSAATPFYGWMMQVSSSTPLFTYALSTGQGLSYATTEIYGQDTAGHPSLPIPPYVV